MNRRLKVTAMAILVLFGSLSASNVRAGSSEYFVDNFDGGELAGHWEIVNPDPESFIVEDGNLLVISSLEAAFQKGNIPNTFILNKPMPHGDWVMTMQLSADIQTGQETISFGLYQDKSQYILAAANFYPGSYNKAMFDLNAIKSSNSKTAEFKREVWRGPGHKSIGEQTRELPNPIVLRLTKKGRTYVASAKLEGGDESGWVEMEKLTSLRAKGNLAISLHQRAKVDGESMIKVDWVKIETLD